MSRYLKFYTPSRKGGAKGWELKTRRVSSREIKIPRLRHAKTSLFHRENPLVLPSSAGEKATVCYNKGNIPNSCVAFGCEKSGQALASRGPQKGESGSVLDCGLSARERGSSKKPSAARPSEFRWRKSDSLLQIRPYCIIGTRCLRRRGFHSKARRKKRSARSLEEDIALNPYTL